MTNGTPSVQEVIADADAARQKLATLEHQLQDDIDAIDFRAFRESRPLTNAEMALRKSRRTTQAEVREGFRVLAYVTAQRLDNADETKQLLRQMQGVNSGLESDLTDLKAITQYATIVAQVTDALAKVAGQLASVAAKVSI